MKIYTGGTFDMFHQGHVNLLRGCRELFDFTYVVVGLNTDSFIEEYKGKPPIISYSDRRAVLEACKYVDKVVPNTHGADSKPTIERVRPDYIVIGDDWKSKDYFKQMGFDQNWLNSMGISLIYLPYTRHISTTEIKKRL
jgi:glycerol-3-phosphate cytidylyltransferase